MSKSNLENLDVQKQMLLSDFWEKCFRDFICQQSSVGFTKDLLHCSRQAGIRLAGSARLCQVPTVVKLENSPPQGGRICDLSSFFSSYT